MVVDDLEGPGAFHIRHARTEEAWQVCTFSGHAGESLVLNHDFNMRLHIRRRDEVHTRAVLFKPVPNGHSNEVFERVKKVTCVRSPSDIVESGRPK